MAGASAHTKHNGDRPLIAWLRKAAFALLLAPSVAGVVAACGSNDGPVQGQPIGAGGASSTVGIGSSGSGQPCTDGDTQDCHVTLGNHGGILSCYNGTQHCEKGTWGGCTDGTVSNGPAPPPPPKNQPYSLTDAGPCLNNPCDPTCMNYDEQPDGGVVINGMGVGVGWVGGNINGLAPGLKNKGQKQSCAVASDCEFDEYCYNPTQGFCGHSVCEADIALLPGCNTCVTQVCAVNPNCCTVAWDATCVQAAHDTCGDICPNAQPSCPHDACFTGVMETAGCDACTDAVCLGDPFCCSTAWDFICVAEVPIYCGVVCPPLGNCVQWNPTQFDGACTGLPDLTAGVTCKDPGTGLDNIPVCNRGTVAAPAGIPIAFWPGASGHMPQCAPVGAPAGSCVTTAPIPPGQCIDVTGCSGFGGQDEIMVNAPLPGQVAECDCQNDWSLYDNGACGVPSCSGVSASSSVRQVDMFITVDKSGSMNTPTRWPPAMAALKAFFQDANSAGLGVALRFWPDNVPSTCDTPSCSQNNCSQPAVALGNLTAAAAPGDVQEQLLINSINAHAPGGGTPMHAALDGATHWAINRKIAFPSEFPIVVLITDGQPTSCGTSIAGIAALAANAYVNYGIPTYVIGIAGVSQATINQIAQAGGGKAFFIQAANPAQTQTELEADMNLIRGSSASCTFGLPPPATFNPGQATVIYTPTVGAQVVYTNVQDLAACGAGDGWYYDNNATPSTITLCPNSCGTVQGDPGANVSIQLGCPGTYMAQTFTQQYVGSCGPGQSVQWGFLAYDTSLPADSQVVFRARTSPDGVTFGMSHTLATASINPPIDPAVCPMGGPPPCPVDLYTKIDIPDDQYSYLELDMDLIPTSNAQMTPTVNSWQITYSCPFTQ